MPIFATGNRGFTMLELLISLVLSSLILMAIVAAFSTVTQSRKRINAHTDALQTLRQTYLETSADFSNIQMLPEMTAQTAAWEPDRMRFPARDPNGKAGIVELEYRDRTLWKTWTPVDLAKLRVAQGRTAMIVNLENLKDVAPVPGRKRYAIARDILSAQFRYHFTEEKPASNSPAMSGSLRRDEFPFPRWPRAVTFTVAIQQKEGASPLQTQWTCPLIQESPWHTASKNSKASF